MHALDLSSLKAPGITFWTAWFNGELAGCGVLKNLDDKHAELKSIRTCQQFLRKGVAAKLVEQLFSVRNAVDPTEAYRAFRGRDADVKALMRDRGFPVTE